MHKLLLASAAILAFTGAAGAADLAYKAAPHALAPATDWSGFYVGLEAGYGWGNNTFDTNLDGANVFPTGPAGIQNTPFAFSGTGSANSNGWLAGGFFGAQKQYGGWVFGIEGDIDATGMRNSFRSDVTAPQTLNAISFLPEFVTTQTQTLNLVGGTVTTPDRTVTVNGQTIVIPGQPLTVQPVTTAAQDVTVPAGAITVNSTGTATIAVGTHVSLKTPDLVIGGVVIIPGITTNFTLTAPVTGAVVTTGTNGAFTIHIPGVTVPGQTITTAPQTIVVNGQTIVVPGGTFPVVNGTVTVPSQTNQVLLANGTPVLQRVLTPTTLDVTRSVAIDTKIDELASLRGRVGYTFWNDVLIYGTGGLALAHASATSTITQTIGTLAPQINSSSASGTMLGWALGAGVDFKVLPNMFVGVEYLHSDFPKNTFAFVDGKGGGFTLGNEHLKVDAVKARVGFLFN